MDNPFVAGRKFRGNEFINRKDEIEHLANNFQAGSNTILISPGKWGKSSIVKKASEQFKNQEQLKFCFVDLNTIRTEEEFYLAFIKEVLLITSASQEDVRNNAQNYLSRYFPRIIFKKESEIEFSLKLDLEEAVHFPEEILNLAENVISKKDYLLSVCLDNFQNVLEFKDHLQFLNKIKLSWAKHLSISYCLSGRKPELLKDMFLNQKMPLYRFGDVLQLPKIKPAQWKAFIIQQFEATGKSIKKQNAKLIITLTDNHPFYVRQLSRLVWLFTIKKCKKSTVGEAFRTMVDQFDLIFQNHTETLSPTQVNFLKAYTDNVDQLSSRKTIDKYMLGTSANVNRIKRALIKKEIISIDRRQIELQDPIFKYWLKRRYFK